MNNTLTALSINDLGEMKNRGEKISCLTAYDASFSQLIDQAGVDVILVGDSLGMIIQGHSTTVPVTMQDMIYHTSCVSKGRQRAFVIADLPFMSYLTPLMAAENAAKLMQLGGAQMVKLEGARIDSVKFLVDQGIPVCGHLGLLPQHINQLGRYKMQGTEPSSAASMIDDALKLEDAGASLLIVECIPASLAKIISTQLSIPVIGIGAGVFCDGQILVSYDMLGLNQGKTPRFCKDFMAENTSIKTAVYAYHQAVKHNQFPSDEYSF